MNVFRRVPGDCFYTNPYKVGGLGASLHVSRVLVLTFYTAVSCHALRHPDHFSGVLRQSA